MPEARKTVHDLSAVVSARIGPAAAWDSFFPPAPMGAHSGRAKRAQIYITQPELSEAGRAQCASRCLARGRGVQTILQSESGIEVPFLFHFGTHSRAVPSVRIRGEFKARFIGGVCRSG